MNEKLWAVATVFEKSWMCESLWWKEIDAISAAKPGQAIILVPIEKPFPDEAVGAEKLYFPNEETWETSKLFQIRMRANESADRKSRA